LISKTDDFAVIAISWFKIPVVNKKTMFAVFDAASTTREKAVSVPVDSEFWTSAHIWTEHAVE
jgi:hypothetical protein